MYCKYCGFELPTDAHVCTACGNSLVEEIQQQKTIAPVKKAADYIGKNKAYFSREFANIEYGAPTKFNWAAFWFNIPYCMYRKQYDILWKYFKVPLIITIITSIVYPIYTYNVITNTDFMNFVGVSSATTVIYLVISLWYFISTILLAKNFNRLYYENLKNIMSQRKDMVKYTGVSVGNIFIWVIVSSIIGYLPGAVLEQSVQKFYESQYVEQEYNVLDENEVVFGYNSYISGEEIDQATINAMKGYYNLGDDISISIDEDLNLNVYAYDEWLCCIEMGLIDVKDNAVVLEGYAPEEYWDSIDVLSQEEARFQLEFLVNNGQVTNIYADGEEIYFQKVSNI